MFISKKILQPLYKHLELYFLSSFFFFVTPPFSYNQQVIIYYVNIIFVSFIDSDCCCSIPNHNDLDIQENLPHQDLQDLTFSTKL